MQQATTLPGHRSLWFHQFAVVGERTVAEVCQTATQYANADVVLFKAMDQNDWMGRFDIDPSTGQPFPEAITGPEAWNAAAAAAANAGVTLVPWVVPGNSGQAAVHAQLGSVLVIDAEPYRGFWASTPDDFVTYIQNLIDLGVSEIYVSTDPRRTQENALDDSTWSPLVAGLLPQVYWTDFRQLYTVVLPMIRDLMQDSPVVIPALPFDGYGDFPAMWDAALKLGVAGASLWVMGSAGPASLQAFGQLSVPSPQPPVDPCAALRDENIALQSALSKYQSKLEAVQAALNS